MSSTPMKQNARTNTTRDSVHTVQHERKVRLLLWGGAYAQSDNSAFQMAAINVAKDYKKDDKNKYEIINKRLRSLQSLILEINDQKPNSIRSLDIFTHGGPDNFFMVTVRNDQDGSFLNNIRLYRYIFHNDSFSRAHLRKLKFENFSEDAKVEIHGCQTAATSDNIVADFSKYLFAAGKTKSVVIGHTTNTDPRINGDKTGIPDQDYRHLERAIYRGGKLLTKTRKTGALDERELAK
ncbi:conserved hypothetical protein [Cupriavidus necator]|uniref:Uncharacterized protein n=1 Tax=Cupriavidus necator TaxID=106590 RepID=A0A1K0INB9_CUPNE|nr:conserved hypothetical protein [Cupriavidus necator]